MAKGSNYLDNAALEAAIRADDRETVARLLYVLADKVIGMYQATFPPGLDVDDLIQIAVLDALRRLETWVPGRSSAFSFATGSVRFSIMAVRKNERAWAERHTTLIHEYDEEAAPC